MTQENASNDDRTSQNVPTEPGTPLSREQELAQGLQKTLEALQSGESITRDDAIAIVTAVGRHCRGPYRTMAQVQALHPSLRRPITEALTMARAQLDVSEAEGADPRFLISTLLAEGMHDQANQIDTVLRATCGYDINELIIEGGFDGDEHQQECPWCGTKLSWRAPWFPELTEGSKE
jgi:hypothetical protein